MMSPVAMFQTVIILSSEPDASTLSFVGQNATDKTRLPMCPTNVWTVSPVLIDQTRTLPSCEPAAMCELSGENATTRSALPSHKSS